MIIRLGFFVKKIITLLFIVTIPTCNLYSQNNEQHDKDYLNISHQIQKLEQENNKLKVDLYDLNNKYVFEIKGLSNNIESLKNTYLHNIYSAQFGAIILILGLLIEIIGATLLAGNNLSSKIKSVYSLTIKADLGDLALNEVTKDYVMKFHGYLGSICLIIGFVFQMTGTIFVIGVSIYVKLIVIISSCFISMWILYYLTGQTPDQTRKEKVLIIWSNIKRLLLLPLKDKIFLSSKIRCDYCLKKSNNGLITFLNEKNSEEYPFLHSPQLFHYCHPECINKIDDYESYFNKNKDWHDSLSKIYLEQISIKEYVESIYPSLIDFFKNQRKDRSLHWENYKGGPDYSEVEAEKMFKKVKKIIHS